ncbi:helix-turn-helix transcriptional regulator [Halobacillus sp. BBL2006]|uniref:helix-turn-helix transcriptional regulator n=1 Tax=Halobacillus sp. BBL2006 TaxID=1543706 RepID=UPI0005435D2A|nr:helix-turn-helix transcriptional regulator [Halobacillus sp. BBL2006]KHE73139.1 hypothetical protein LD39_00665 [Halobacillus sp. BBL2006]
MDIFINEWIDKRGYKKKWVAEQLGVSGNVLSRWANGRSVPSLEHALDLAKLLECKVEDLFKK